MSENSKAAKEIKLPFGRGLAYSLGDFGGGCSNVMFASYFLIYSTNCLGIPAARASTVLILARIFDIVNDSWWGNWTDNAPNSKFGKYRKQMLTWLLPFVAVTFAFFNCPVAFLGTVKAEIWAYVFYFAWTFCYSAYNCAYMGLVSVITPSHKTRGSLSSWRTGFMMAGNIMIANIVTHFTGIYGENVSTGWRDATIILMIISLVVCTITVLGSKEIIQVEPKPKDQRDGIIKNIKTCLSNRQFMLCAVVSIAVGVAMNGRTGVMAYYFLYIAHDYMAMGTFATVFSLGALSGCLLFQFFANALKSKGKACQVYALLAIVSTVVMYFSASDINSTLWHVGTFLSFFGTFGLMAGFFGMTPDTADYGYNQTGNYQIGVYSAMITFWHKWGFVIIQGTMGFFLSAAGFNAAAEMQTAATTSVINLEFFWLPCLFLFLVIVLMHFYKLDYKKCDEVRAENIAKYGEYVM